MSGIERPANVPDANKLKPYELDFLKRLISRFPQFDEVHLISTGIVYFGDSETNGSWRITRSGNNLVIQRRESGTWTTKSTISA